MAFLHGKDAKLFMNGRRASAYVKSASLSAEVDLADTNILDSSWKTRLPGMRDASISLEGFVDLATGASFDLFKDSLGVLSHLALLPQGDTAGNLAMLMHGRIASVEMSADTDDAENMSVEVQSNEGVRVGKVLMAQATVTGTGTSAALDMDAVMASGFVAYLHVADLLASTVVVKIQESADGALGWVDKATFTIGAADFTSERIKVDTSTQRYVRVSYTVTGGTGAPIAVQIAAQ